MTTDKPALASEIDRLRTENKELRIILDKALGLVARGFNEGAYTKTCGGDQYAEKVMAWAQKLIDKAQS